MKANMHGLFVMSDLPWPLHGGRELYTHHLLLHLMELGHTPRLILGNPPTAEQLAAWPLHRRVAIDTLPASLSDAPETPSRLGRLWSRYWGWSEASARAVAAYAEIHSADYVAAAGLSTLPLLARVPATRKRIWLALDDPCLFQLSLLSAASSTGERWSIAKQAMKMALYERSYRADVDAVVAVSSRDAKALRSLGGFRDVLLMPNGVDANFFRPFETPVDPKTLIFWGRLDFQPNLDAIRWFTTEVWPVLRHNNPTATWRIVGQNAGDAVHQLIDGKPGIELIGAVDDLRPWALRSGATVLPMRSGAGIKNKLLEAAAMGRPIVASPRAVEGLRGEPAWRVADTTNDWVEAIESLWAKPADAAELGTRARQWAVKHYSWASNACDFDRLVGGAATALPKSPRDVTRRTAA